MAISALKPSSTLSPTPWVNVDPSFTVDNFAPRSLPLTSKNTCQKLPSNSCCLMVAAILWFIMDTSWFKGKLGEILVARSFKKYLDRVDHARRAQKAHRQYRCRPPGK